MTIITLMLCVSCNVFEKNENASAVRKIEIPEDLQTTDLNERQIQTLITMNQPTSFDELDGYWKYQIGMTEYQLRYMDEKYGGYHICNYTAFESGYVRSSYVTRCYEIDDPTREFKIWTEDGEFLDNYKHVMAAKMVDDYMSSVFIPYGDNVLYYIEDVWQDGNYYQGEIELDEILKKCKIEGQVIFMESDSDLEIMKQRLKDITVWLNDNMHDAKGSIMLYVQPDDYFHELTKANCKDMHVMRTIDYYDSEGKKIEYFRIVSKQGRWTAYLMVNRAWTEL